MNLFKTIQITPHYSESGKTKKLQYKTLVEGVSYEKALKAKTDFEEKNFDKIDSGEIRIAMQRDHQSEKFNKKAETKKKTVKSKIEE